jgi:hypothetical protein
MYINEEPLLHGCVQLSEQIPFSPLSASGPLISKNVHQTRVYHSFVSVSNGILSDQKSLAIYLDQHKIFRSVEHHLI